MKPNEHHSAPREPAAEMEAAGGLLRPDDYFYNELTRANNQLANVQREMALLNINLERQVMKRTEELVAATEEARRAERAKSEFLSRTSHELRTPMNAILGFGQVLEMETNLGPEERDSVEHILKAGHHLMRLIDRLLDISNARSGQLPVNLAPVALDQLIAETLCLVRPLAVSMGIEVKSPNECSRHVRGDRHRLKQALLNLLSNAIQYNRPGGEVRIECAVASPFLRFSVMDNGPGISPDRLSRLFTPFNRLEHPTEKRGTTPPGSGLGLAFSQSIVQAMGGRLGVESVVGQGSNFWIELPLAEFPSAPVSSNPALSIAGPGWGMP